MNAPQEAVTGSTARAWYGEAADAYQAGVAAERARWRPALTDALEGLQDMFPYVPEYFQDKWEHRGYVDRAQNALADLIGDDT